MTNLVVFYSRAGTTKTVAETIAQEKNAKLIEVKDKKNRSGGLRYLTSAVDSLISSGTDIEYEKVNLSDYDTIYIGTPVWTQRPSLPIREYLKENDFSNTNVVTFATMGSAGGTTTVNAMNDVIKSKGGNILYSFSFSQSGNTKEKTLKALEEHESS